MVAIVGGAHTIVGRHRGLPHTMLVVLAISLAQSGASSPASVLQPSGMAASKVPGAADLFAKESAAGDSKSSASKSAAHLARDARAAESASSPAHADAKAAAHAAAHSKLASGASAEEVAGAAAAAAKAAGGSTAECAAAAGEERAKVSKYLQLATARGFDFGMFYDFRRTSTWPWGHQRTSRILRRLLARRRWWADRQARGGRLVHAAHR